MALVASASSTVDPAHDVAPGERVQELFAEHGDGVFRLALLMLGQRDQAEDVVQDTFLRLLRHVANGGPLANARGWIYTVAAHACRDRQRASRRWLPWNAGHDSRIASDQPDATEAARDIVRAIAALSPRDRLLIALRIEGCSYQDIADAAGIAPSSTGRIVTRALDRLARSLGVSR